MNLSRMSYACLITRTITLVTLVICAISLQAQDQSDWYDTRTKSYQAQPTTTDIKTSDSKLALRIVFGNYIIKVSLSDNDQFDGHLIVHTSSYEEGHYKVKLSQKYFSDLAINPDTARMIYDLYTVEG